MFRAMKADPTDNQPAIGESATSLGVRSDGNHSDVQIDSDGNVVQNQKGMSVAPDWRSLPNHRVPKRLREKYGKSGPRGPTAADNIRCYRLGKGAFERSKVGDDLEMIPDNPSHGVIAPIRQMSILLYRSLLNQTREYWVIDED